jgi:type IV secretory pathway VirB10-like protein
MRRQRVFPALLCGAALFAFACGGDREAERVDAEKETKPAEESWQIVDEPAEETRRTSAEQANELNPEPKEVQIEPRDLERETELEEREQRLAERQAELAARERELRERESRAEARPSPRPEPRAEPVREPEPAPAEDTEEVAESREAEPVEERFEEEARPEPAEEERAERTPMLVATVPAGTVMEAELLQELSSNGSAAGETFRARLVSGVQGDGATAIPAGSEVVGVIEEAVPLTRRVGGRAKLTLRFTDLVLPSGATVPIRASLVEQGRSETRKDAATIGGAAAGGAILGRILNRKDRSRGAVIGAIIGAAAGTAIASRTPGEEVVFPEGTVVSLNLDQDVEVRSRR